MLVPSSARRLTAVDLFAGCGGFSLGIIQAGLDVLAAVEWDAVAAMTYMVNLGAYPIDIRFVEEADRERFEKELTPRKKKGVVSSVPLSGSNRDPNVPGVPVFWFGDIRKISGADVLKSIGLDVGELDLIVGGPPCQGFSIAGKQNVMDPRNSLVFEFARLICEMRPKTLCMENVTGILSMVTEHGIPVIDEFCAILERGNYGEHEALLRMLSGAKHARIARRGKPSTKSTRGDAQTCLFT
ncbi:MAG: DNA cytosine methyltransferase [Bryobacteraceae bacterium]